MTALRVGRKGSIAGAPQHRGREADREVHACNTLHPQESQGGGATWSAHCRFSCSLFVRRPTPGGTLRRTIAMLSCGKTRQRLASSRLLGLRCGRALGGPPPQHLRRGAGAVRVSEERGVRKTLGTRKRVPPEVKARAARPGPSLGEPRESKHVLRVRGLHQGSCASQSTCCAAQSCHRATCSCAGAERGPA